MVDESQEDGDGAQSLHVGTKTAISRWSSRLVTRHRGWIDGDRHRYRRGAPLSEAGSPITPPRPPTTARP